MEIVKVMYLVTNYNGWGDSVIIKHHEISVHPDNNIIDVGRVVENKMPNYHSFEYQGQRIISKKYLKLKGVIR